VSVQAQVKSDLTTAMKAGERDRVGALRLVLSELQKAEKDGTGDELSVLRRERKRRADAAAQFREAGRDELADQEESEAALIDGYLPAQMSDSDLEAIVSDAVAKSGASGPQDMGKVMGMAIKAVDGRADGGRVSGLVKEKLAALA
jgi:uncharacterized protein YqeY